VDGGIVFAALSPHPPIIVPEVGGREAEHAADTVRGMEKLASRIAEARPETIVVITPHGPVLRDSLLVAMAQPLAGDFSQFGAPGVVVKTENDEQLSRRIIEEAARRGIRCVPLEREVGLDHGSLVPLYYLSRAGIRCRLVSVTMGMLSRRRLYEFGKGIQVACAGLSRRCAVIASGDLSHRLVRGAPAGYSPRGKEFDRAICDALREGDPRPIESMDERLAEDAGECGLRPLLMMFGALDGLEYESELISYEGPFGVGYAVATFKVTGAARSDRAGDGRRMPSRDPYVSLAKMSLESFVRYGRRAEKPADLPPDMRRRAGAFVSLKKFGRLRGCIGTIEPCREDLASEIIQNAISAGTEDPRFPPVTEDELDDLEYSVDVLGVPEEVAGAEELDPRRYGVIIQKGHRRGLLLPDLEGVDTVEKQLAIARQKAGISPGEAGVRLFRFTVERHRY
jgi:AmmeMemoRadiSam system protein A/AmmeMemoRadiSam system protein B